MDYVNNLVMFGGMIVQLFVLFLILSSIGGNRQEPVPSHGEECHHH